MLSGDCNVCINGKLPSYSATCAECGLSRKNFKPITNADRIISNVESLAKFIVEIADCAECEEMHGFRMCDAAANKACEDCWLDWLRQEVADD